MTILYTANVIPLSGGDTILQMKAALVAAGNVITASGNGSTFSTSGDVITTAAQLNTVGSWFVWRQPGPVAGVTRQYCWQNGAATGLTSRFKYSYSAGFTGGAPSATVTPTASDQRVLWGAGTDAAPTYVTTIGGTPGVNRLQMGFDNAAPYGWFAFAYLAIGGATAFGFMNDPLLPGSYFGTDNDPYVLYGATPATAWAADMVATTQTAGSLGTFQTFLAKGLAGENFVSISPASPSFGTVVATPGGLGPNPITAADDALGIQYGRAATWAPSPTGFKGTSSLMHLKTTARTTADCLTVSTPRDFIIVGNAVLPWGGTDPI